VLEEGVVKKYVAGEIWDTAYRLSLIPAKLIYHGTNFIGVLLFPQLSSLCLTRYLCSVESLVFLTIDPSAGHRFYALVGSKGTTL